LGRCITPSDDGEQIAFKGRDMNKNGKFVVIRTYSTDSKKLRWLNGLVDIIISILTGKNIQGNEDKSCLKLLDVIGDYDHNLLVSKRLYNKYLNAIEQTAIN
jgi:hypothetical protein